MNQGSLPLGGHSRIIQCHSMVGVGCRGQCDVRRIYDARTYIISATHTHTPTNVNRPPRTAGKLVLLFRSICFFVGSTR